jgi:hypothetical protein
MWVQELIDGHPDRIRHELGVPKHVFKQLVDELSSHGHHHSKHITLEEQLGIFSIFLCDRPRVQARRGTFSAVERHYFHVFMFPSGFTTRVLTVVRSYFRKMLIAFSSRPIYTKYIHQITTFRRPDTFAHRRRPRSIPILQRRGRCN